MYVCGWEGTDRKQRGYKRKYMEIEREREREIERERERERERKREYDRR